MNAPEPVSKSVGPTSGRLLLAIAGGVVVISATVGLGAGAPMMVVLLPSLLLVAMFVGLVLYEVGRLLEDDRDD